MADPEALASPAASRSDSCRLPPSSGGRGCTGRRCAGSTAVRTLADHAPAASTAPGVDTGPRGVPVHDPAPPAAAAGQGESRPASAAGNIECMGAPAARRAVLRGVDEACGDVAAVASEAAVACAPPVWPANPPGTSAVMGGSAWTGDTLVLRAPSSMPARDDAGRGCATKNSAAELGSAGGSARSGAAAAAAVAASASASPPNGVACGAASLPPNGVLVASDSAAAAVAVGGGAVSTAGGTP